MYSEETYLKYNPSKMKCVQIKILYGNKLIMTDIVFDNFGIIMYNDQLNVLRNGHNLGMLNLH